VKNRKIVLEQFNDVNKLIKTPIPNVAAKIIFKNVNNKKFEITFPWLFSALMKFLTYLPDNLSYKLIKYVTLYDKEK